MRTLIILLAASRLFAVSVTTAQYNNSRTNANTSETILTQANVSAGKFGRRGVFSVDGFVYAQPLVVDGVSISGATRVLVIATMHNSIYAFDADNPQRPYLWKVNVGTSMTSYPQISDGFTYLAEIGCWATPVVDASAGVVYETCVTSAGAWKLYALNLSDGTTYHAAATFAGTSNGLTFDSVRHIQRAGLLLSGGNIYVAFCGWADELPYQGWVFSCSATSLSCSVWAAVNHPGVSGFSYNCSSNCGAAGIWMAGNGLAADGSGNVYFMTGNGDWDGSSNFGESFVKLSSSLSVLDYMTPSNWATLNSGDTDLGSGRMALIGSSFVMGGGKDGAFWLLNQSAMGSLQGSGSAIAQTWATGKTLFGGLAYANNALFLSGLNSTISRYAFNGSTFTTTPSASTVSSFSSPGATVAYSSNGSTSGTDILWAVTVAASAFHAAKAGTFRAFNATTMVELYSDATLGTYAKFSDPTVANGNVYVATFDNQVVMYGLTAAAIRGKANVRGKANAR